MTCVRLRYANRTCGGSTLRIDRGAYGLFPALLSLCAVCPGGIVRTHERGTMNDHSQPKARRGYLFMAATALFLGTASMIGALPATWNTMLVGIAGIPGLLAAVGFLWAPQKQP